MTVVLETPRLVLREMSAADLGFVAEMLADPQVMRYWPRCYTREEASDWIDRQRARYVKDGVGYWLAISKASQQPVGQAGLLVMQIDGASEVGLGYILHRPFWRMGYASEAAEACRDYAFTHMAQNRVVAVIRPENEPSQRVAQRLGMIVEKRTVHAEYEHLVFVATRRSGLS